MEWFHFSDFHIGGPRGPQSIALSSLLEAVQSVCHHASRKVDAVFITGDIAYSGKLDEYKRFCDDFLSPLRSIPNFSDTPVFTVPGNHDINCDAALPIAWDSIGNRNQQVFFCEDETGVKVRSARMAVFNEYNDFVQSNDIISPNPAKEVTIFHSNDSYPFDILATNTAFFSDMDNDSSGELTPSPLDSLRQKIQSLGLLKKVDTPNSQVV